MLRSIEELSPAEWRTLIDTNLSAIYFFCRRLWPIWRRQGGGVVVNVSSVSARDPFAGLGAYGAAKAGVNLLGLALAREGAAIHVRVHTIRRGRWKRRCFDPCSRTGSFRRKMRSIPPMWRVSSCNVFAASWPAPAGK